MLSSDEKVILQNYDKLGKKDKAKANFNYRVSRKVKKILSELEEVNEVLDKIPEKTTRRVLDDDMVASIFTLTEKMLKIMGYSAVKVDYMGAGYVAKAEPPRKSRDGQSKTIQVTTELANMQAMARQALVDDHLDVLNHLMKEPPLGLPISEVSDCILDHIMCNDPKDVVEARQMLTKWGRPGMRTFEDLRDRLGVPANDDNI